MRTKNSAGDMARGREHADMLIMDLAEAVARSREARGTGAQEQATLELHQAAEALTGEPAALELLHEWTIQTRGGTLALVGGNLASGEDHAHHLPGKGQDPGHACAVCVMEENAA